MHLLYLYMVNTDGSRRNAGSLIQDMAPVAVRGDGFPTCSFDGVACVPVLPNYSTRFTYRNMMSVILAHQRVV
jgi:hypothetical protein